MARAFVSALACLTSSAALLFVACAPVEEPDAPTPLTRTSEIQLAAQTMPPRGITIQVPLEHVLASGGVQTLVGHRRFPQLFAGPGDPPLPIFLNRNGGTYSPGNDDSRTNTSIVPNTRSTVSAFSGSNTEWQGFVDCITTMFAPYNCSMTETEPAGGEYIEAVIGGTPQQVGLPNGVGGVAPIDSFQCNIIPNAIIYTFSEVVGNDPQTTCEIAAQEIAHALSLDHEYYCPDPMTYLGGCGDKTFRDYDAQCGEYQPRNCNCGRPSQNSVQTIIDKLGTNTGMPPPPPPNDPNPPTVSITSPADGASLPQNSTITVTADAMDDMQLAATELIWEFSNSVFGCPTNVNAGSVTCVVNGNTSTWTLNVGQGDRRFSVRARDAANNVTTTPTRTIHLGNVVPPPMDTVPPTVNVTSPVDNAMLLANSTIRIVGTAADDTGLASVDLVWDAGQQSTFPCPFSGQGVSCAANNGTYTWELQVGVGTRRFSVRATDLAGNQAQTQQRTIVLSTDTGMPPPVGQDTVAEPNNDPQSSFPARCGNAIDLVVAMGNDDWFSFDAPNGTTVEVAVAATAGSVIGVSLYHMDGTTQVATTDDVLANGGSIRGLSTGPVLLAKITTNSPALAYRLTALCTTEPPINPPGDDSLEENDDPGSASRVNCADVRTNLTAADPDYFVVNVAEGKTLKVSVSGQGVQATVLDANGTVLGGPAVDPAGGGAPAGDLFVKVEPTAGTTTYDARFDCVSRDGNRPDIPSNVNSGQLSGGCACSASGSSPASSPGSSPAGSLAPLFAFALVAWFVRRRGL